MYLDWSTLVALCLAGAIAWFWTDSLAARESANRAALAACEDMGLQLLDGTVAFARIRLGRGATGRLSLLRTYIFDYTADSIERRQGFVLMKGWRVETVGYAPDDRHRHATQRASRSDAAEPGRVVHLQDRRVSRPNGASSGDRTGD